MARQFRPQGKRISGRQRLAAGLERHVDHCGHARLCESAQCCMACAHCCAVSGSISKMVKRLPSRIRMRSKLIPSSAWSICCSSICCPPRGTLILLSSVTCAMPASLGNLKYWPYRKVGSATTLNGASLSAIRPSLEYYRCSERYHSLELPWITATGNSLTAACHVVCQSFKKLGRSVRTEPMQTPDSSPAGLTSAAQHD